MSDELRAAGDALADAVPPRFERGFYRLARDLDDGAVRISAGPAYLNHEYADGWQVLSMSGNTRGVSAAALAAAGAERVEEGR